jgi:hypothetical protein
MGKAYQAWSAASYVSAYLRFQGNTSIEVGERGPDEVQQRRDAHLANNVTSAETDLDKTARPDPVD